MTATSHSASSQGQSLAPPLGVQDDALSDAGTDDVSDFELIDGDTSQSETSAIGLSSGASATTESENGDDDDRSDRDPVEETADLTGRLGQNETVDRMLRLPGDPFESSLDSAALSRHSADVNDMGGRAWSPFRDQARMPAVEFVFPKMETSGLFQGLDSSFSTLDAPKEYSIKAADRPVKEGPRFETPIKEEDPLIQINWRKVQRLCQSKIKAWLLLGSIFLLFTKSAIIREGLSLGREKAVRSPLGAQPVKETVNLDTLPKPSLASNLYALSAILSMPAPGTEAGANLVVEQSDGAGAVAGAGTSVGSVQKHEREAAATRRLKRARSSSNDRLSETLRETRHRLSNLGNPIEDYCSGDREKPASTFCRMWSSGGLATMSSAQKGLQTNDVHLTRSFSDARERSLMVPSREVNFALARSRNAGLSLATQILAEPMRILQDQLGLALLSGSLMMTQLSTVVLQINRHVLIPALAIGREQGAKVLEEILAQMKKTPAQIVVASEAIRAAAIEAGLPEAYDQSGERAKWALGRASDRVGEAREHLQGFGQEMKTLPAKVQTVLLSHLELTERLSHEMADASRQLAKTMQPKAIHLYRTIYRELGEKANLLEEALKERKRTKKSRFFDRQRTKSSSDTLAKARKQVRLLRAKLTRRDGNVRGLSRLFRD